MFGVAGLRMRLLTNGQVASTTQRLTYAAWSLLAVAGHLCGGAVLGGALGWCGGALSPVVIRVGWAVLAMCSLGWAASEAGLLRLPMPQLHRQVPRGWMGRLPWNAVAIGYGIQLGCGIATRVTVTTTYATLAAALLSGSPRTGAVIGGAFGLARAVLPLCVFRPVSSPEASMRVAEAFTDYEHLMRKTNSVALLIAAFVFIWPAVKG